MTKSKLAAWSALLIVGLIGAALMVASTPTCTGEAPRPEAGTLSAITHDLGFNLFCRPALGVEGALVALVGFVVR